MIQGIYRLNGKNILSNKGLSRGDGSFTEYFIPELDKWVNSKRLKLSLKEIGISTQDYYDKYVLEILDSSERPKCPYCGKECIFIEIGKGYRTTCGDEECISKEYTECQKYSRVHNPDRWKRQSETVKNLYKDEEYKERWNQSRREKMYDNPTYRLNNKLAQLKSWRNPSDARLATMSGGHYHKAWVYSPYENKDIHLDSSWEQKFFSDIQEDPEVVLVIRPRDPISYVSPLDNEIHSYFPDFLVEYLDGRKELIEIKPEYKLSNPVVKEKIKVLSEYCEFLGIEYRILTELNYKF